MTASVGLEQPGIREPLSSRVSSLFHSLKPAHVPRRLVGHVAMTALVIVVIVASHNSTINDSLESFSFDQESALVPAAFVSRQLSVQDVLVKRVVPYTDEVNRPKQDIITHSVRPGESVSAIADLYSISVQTILWSNDLSEAGLIQPGEQLTILPVSGVLHTVSLDENENIEEIAQKYQSDVDSIIEFNRITDPANLRPGDPLVIPGGRELSSLVQVSPSSDKPDEAARPDAQAAAEEATKLRPLEQKIAEPEPVVLEPFLYIVNPGDTLNSLGMKFGISIESIIWANDLLDDVLQIDQELIVPPVSGVIHEVVEGETVRSIARRYDASPTEIVDANGMMPPYILQIGQTLVIPGGEPPPPPPVGPQVVHVVSEGESVAAIAEKYSVNVLAVIRSNGLLPPYTIVPDQRLAVPGGVTRAAAPVVRQPAVAAAARAEAEAAVDAAEPTLARTIIGTASKYMGFPYVWGGSSPNVGFDCSGYTWWIFQEIGNPIPRDLWGQLQAGQRVDYDSLQTGDMIFFVNTYQPGLSHNGLYIGGGRFIHAASENTGVIISSLGNPYWSSRYYAGARHW